MTPPRPWALAASVALGFFACHGSGKEEIETEAAVPVEARPARRGTIHGIVSANGLVSPALGADQVVTAPQAGRIADLPRTEGDPVRKGDLLVRFDIPSLRSEAASRSSELAQAEARLVTAREAYTRVSGLLERGIAARKEVEEAERALREAEAALAQTRIGSGAAEDLSARATVRALFDGVVVHRSGNPGDVVDASATDPILRVIDPARLEVEASVALVDAPRIAVGHHARVSVAGAPAGAAAEAATVRSRPAAVSMSTGMAGLRLSFDHPTRLAVGSPVQVEIEAEERANAVVVPAIAVQGDGKAAWLFVVGPEGHAHRRPVELGVTGGAESEIVSGVAEGERVVVKGQQSLPDGAAVSAAP